MHPGLGLHLFRLKSHLSERFLAAGEDAELSYQDLAEPFSFLRRSLPRRGDWRVEVLAAGCVDWV